ncbi:DUF262 domain-containing protein [Candidatus Woesearchaeota archaeon]|nr:DUF262 domain-containing protein [Candidatus Woesearchaeota archaeon]
MIQSSKDTPIHELFSPELTIKFVIPKYQREYTWKKENWDDLFNDIMGENDSEEGPFLGSIICVNKTTEVLNSELEIIDGQQRLTTLSLFYAAVHTRLLIEEKEDDDFRSELINLKYRLVQKKKPKETKLELSYQNNNFEDYKEILEESGILEVKEGRPKNLRNRRLYKAYSFFLVKLEPYSFTEVRRLLDKINSSHIIKIEVNTSSDAFNLFESINNRGVPLSAIDLIKNSLLSHLEKNKSKTMDDAFEEWKIITDNLTEDPKIQERFLRHYYNAFKHNDNIKVKIKEGKATKSNLIYIYEQLIKKDAIQLLNDLKNKSQTISRCINPEDTDEFYKEFTDLLRISGTPSYIFLLYLLTDFKHNKELLKETISFLSKYFVRRNLTDYPATRNLDNIFVGLIEDCEKNKKNLNYEIIKTFLTNPERYANDDIFREKLESNIYEINSEVTRYILCKIEEESFTKESDIDLWKREKDKYIFTIEHILPEGERLPKEWINMIAKGDKDEAKKLQEQFVHKLGNLTLTAYNSNLSNLSFEKKRDRKDKKGKNIGYKNNLYLNGKIYPLQSKNEWAIGDIEKRTKVLIDEALKLFG